MTRVKSWFLTYRMLTCSRSKLACQKQQLEREKGRESRTQHHQLHVWDFAVSYALLGARIFLRSGAEYTATELESRKAPRLTRPSFTFSLAVQSQDTVVEPTMTGQTELRAREPRSGSKYTRGYRASRNRQLCSFCSSEDRWFCWWSWSIVCEKLHMHHHVTHHITWGCHVSQNIPVSHSRSHFPFPFTAILIVLYSQWEENNNNLTEPYLRYGIVIPATTPPFAL